MEYKIREKLFGANKTSASGTSLTLNDTVKYPINKLTIDGVCKQETTTGKNLLDYVSNLITSANGLTNVINEDGSITTTGKPTSNYSTIIKTIDITDILEDGQTYTISQGNASDNVYVQIAVKKVDGTFARITSARGSKSFEVNKTIYTNYSIMLQTNTISSWGDSSLTITNKYMLCKGTDTADTSFEPYTGGQPSPSPDYPQPISTIENSLKITSCNKNLFNSNLKKGGRLFNNGNYFSANNYIHNEQPLKVIGGETYTISAKGYNSSIEAGFVFFKDGKFVSSIKQKSTTVTIPNDVNELYYDFSLGTSTIIDIDSFSDYQLELGPAATDYEQHLETQITANLPENEFVGKLNDTYKDTLNVVYKNDGHYHLILNKMVGKVVLNGSEEYTNSGLSSNNYIHMMKTIINNIKSAANDDEFVPVMSNYFSNGFSYTSLGYSIAGTNGITIAQNNILTICHSGYTKENTEGFKNWLSTHNVEVYYALATSYEVDLGIVDTLLSYDEITNIFTDSDLQPVINVKYYNGSLDISNYEFSIKEV